VNIVAPQTHNR